MRRLRQWMKRMLGMSGPGRRECERELAAELESHLQLHIDDNLRAGMSEQQARREAILKLGGVEAAKEAYREQSTIPLVDHIWHDARFALRQLRKNPGFAITAVLMLALGMGASIAIFSFVDAALLKPLPYPNPRRLVGVFESVAMIPQSNLSYPDYLDWKRMNKVFRSLDVWEPMGAILTTAAGPQPAHGARVTDGFFRTLGVAPLLGRDFYAGEDLASAPRTVLLSYAVWQSRYNGRPDVLGRSVILNGEPNTIIGVLPRDFHFSPAEPADYWTALHAASECDLRRSCHSLYGVARLKDGVSVESAQAQMKSIAKLLEQQYPGDNRGQGASVILLSEFIVGYIRPILLALLGGAMLLLVIACVNVASLLLVRSESRRREIAVRSALGASRGRLTSQFVTEGLVLVAAGSALGLALAYWAMQLLTKLIPEQMYAGMSYFHDLSLNPRVFAFAGLIALVGALVFSVTPALRLPLSEMRVGLAEGSRGSAGNTWRRLGSKLVVLELATAVVLLVGAGLLGKSLYLLLHVENGFQPDHLAVVFVAAPKSGYEKDEQIVALEREVVGRFASLPGVHSVGVSVELPVSGNGNTDWIRILGKPYHGEHNEVNEREVSSDYFKTLQAKLLHGRFFGDDEDATKRLVVVINQALARKYFPGEDPIGKQIGNDDLNPKSMKLIIGIVDDIREGSLDSEVWPAVYYPFNQNPSREFAVVVRTSQAEQLLLPTLVATIRQIDPGIVAHDESTMNARIANSYTAYMHRSAAWLVGGFAVLAFALSVIGLYGVVAYSVSQRSREIGVRMALGAARRNVYQLVLKEAGWLAGAGVTIGVVCAVGAAKLINGLLFGVDSWDAPTLAGVAVSLGAASLLASYIPARRAASVNPVDSLRAE